MSREARLEVRRREWRAGLAAVGLVALGAAAAGGAAVGGCRSEPPAAADPEVVARCEAVGECACTSFSSRAQCESAVGAAVDSLRVVAEGAGLVRDETCVARMVAAYDAVGCAAAGDDTVTEGFFCEVAFCPIFHGTAGNGAPCKIHGNYLAAITECMPDLGCFGGACVPAGCGIGAGLACVSGGAVTGRCAAGFFCDVSGSGTCMARVALGAACVTDGCVDGAWCDTGAAGGPVCVPLLADGVACTQARQCASGACDAASGTCVKGSTAPYVCGPA